MTEDLMAELAKLQHYAGGLRTLLDSAQAEAPGRAEGADQSGTIRAVLGPDGLPESFRVESGWHRSMEPSAFGGAVLEAAQAATGERLAVWTRTLQEQGWQSKVDRLKADDPVPGEPTPGTVPPAFRRAEQQPPRPLDALAEDMIKAFGDIGQAGPPAPVTGTGSVASGKLVITLARTGLVSCVADPEWVSRQSATLLTNLLGDALRAARADLPAASAAMPNQSPLDALFSEALAVLGDPQRLQY